MEQELVRLRHLHEKLKEVARDLDFDAMTLFFTLVLGGCVKLCPMVWAMFDLLIFFSIYFISEHEPCS